MEASEGLVAVRHAIRALFSARDQGVYPGAQGTQLYRRLCDLEAKLLPYAVIGEEPPEELVAEIEQVVGP